MRKLVLKMSMSLDGFVCGPTGELDWLFRSASPDSTAWVVDTIAQAGAQAMGSRTYRTMAAHWPQADGPIAAAMNAAPKIVFSRGGVVDATRVDPTRPVPSAEVLDSWAAPVVARGDLREEVARVKAQDGGYVLVHGGASIARGLVAADLVDEYRLVVHPIALGRGEPLFSSLNQPFDLRLVSATSFSGGVIAAVYHRAGVARASRGRRAGVARASRGRVAWTRRLPAVLADVAPR